MCMFFLAAALPTFSFFFQNNIKNNDMFVLDYNLPYFVPYKWTCNGGSPYCSKYNIFTLIYIRPPCIIYYKLEFTFAPLRAVCPKFGHLVEISYI